MKDRPMTASAPITQDVVTIPRKDAPGDGRVNLVGLTRDGLREALLAAGTPEKQVKMRVNQVWQWVYFWGVRDFAEMTNLSKDYRALLAEKFSIALPEIVSKHVSADGTRKYLVRIAGGHEVETVYIPEEDRGTLCISSQVGCTLTCSFCHTGTQKLVRNLTAAEIVGQVIGCMLAVSFHATTDDVRDRLVPINKRWPIAELLEALRAYPKASNSERITFEYVMLKGVNDSDEDARRLVKLIQGIPAKINLIPFNEWPGAPYERSDWSRIEAFADIVYKAGYASPIRTPRGEDIMAACGQLKSATERARKSRAEIAAEAGLN